MVRRSIHTVNAFLQQNVFEDLLVLSSVLGTKDSNEQKKILCTLGTYILVGETNNKQVKEYTHNTMLSDCKCCFIFVSLYKKNMQIDGIDGDGVGQGGDYFREFLLSK